MGLHHALGPNSTAPAGVRVCSQNGTAEPCRLAQGKPSDTCLVPAGTQPLPDALQSCECRWGWVTAQRVKALTVKPDNLGSD